MCSYRVFQKIFAKLSFPKKSLSVFGQIHLKTERLRKGSMLSNKDRTRDEIVKCFPKNEKNVMSLYWANVLEERNMIGQASI